MRVLAAVFVIAVGLTAVAPAQAHGGIRNATRENASSVTWAQRDAAVYVVSTLNLLRSRQGQPMGRLFKSRFGVRYYDVYADASNRNLYFIELRGQFGRDVANFAYKMGWQKPEILSAKMATLQVTLAPDWVVASFHSDKKVKIGRFTSTLPA